jgi:hypothetical protein
VGTFLGVQGFYRYQLDGRAMPIEETFTKHGSGWTARRRSDAATVTVEATAESDGSLSDVRVGWDGSVRRELRVIPGGRGRLWQINSGEGTASEEEVDGGALLFPLLRCFQGAAIRAIHAAGPDGCRVVVPDITDPADSERLLCPRFDTRRVTRTGDGSYLYVGGSYDSGARCAVATDGLLERYSWDQPGVGRWLVTLERDGLWSGRESDSATES